jgi:hypothetical protein
MEDRSPKLLDQLRAAIRVRHYSIRTENAYCDEARASFYSTARRHVGIVKHMLTACAEAQFCDASVAGQL